MSRFPTRFRGLAALGAFLLVCTGSLVGQETPASLQPSLTATLATETIDGTNYQSVGLLPDVGLGPFGVGFDLTFHFRFYEQPSGAFGIYPRAADFWDSSLTLNQNIDKYLSRIVYLRWGKKGEPLYIQAGLLPSTSLGSGFLVGGYSNGALRPAKKYIGAVLDADGALVNLPYGGLESFVGNLSTFDVLGGRFYLKPLAILAPDAGLIKDLQVGFTAAGDTNPWAQSSVKGTGAAAVWGMDVIVPVYSAELFSAKVSVDGALEGTHPGASLGLGGQAFGLLSWGLQNRFLGDNFLPDYFDRGYEINRVSKYRILSSSDVVVPGTIGWLVSLGTSLLADQLSFGASLAGPWTSQPSVLAQPRLESYAQVKAGLLPVGLDAYYVKSGLTSWDKLVSPQDALIGAKLSYPLGAVTLSVIYNLRYLSDSEVSTNGERWVTTSRIETSVKMF